MARKNQKATPSKPQPARPAAPKHPPAGDGLDRSTEGVIEVSRSRLKPAGPDALPDRHTADAKRRT